jgi:DNA-binding PadR family transcriptional regulator
MSLEKDILKLLKTEELPYHEILKKLENKYEGSEIGKAITKLKKEEKIEVTNETLFVYEITDLGSEQLKNTFIKFIISDWKWIISTLIIIIGSIIAILTYLKK